MQLTAAGGSLPLFMDNLPPLSSCSVCIPHLSFSDKQLQKSAVYDVCNYQYGQLRF